MQHKSNLTEPSPQGKEGRAILASPFFKENSEGKPMEVSGAKMGVGSKAPGKVVSRQRVWGPRQSSPPPALGSPGR